MVDHGRLRRISPLGLIAAVPGPQPAVIAVAAAPDGGAFVIVADDRILRLDPKNEFRMQSAECRIEKFWLAGSFFILNSAF